MLTITQSPLSRLWFVLRCYSLLCSFVAAQISGVTFLRVWERWDVVYYKRIVVEGYSASSATTNFHPLFSWLAVPLSFFWIDPIASLLIVSSLSTLFLYFAFEKLAEVDQDATTARTATLLFAFWPIAYILYLPYSEALWLVLAVICLYFSRKQQWWWAGLAGGLAVLTRQQGLFLLVPVGWELWSDARHDLKYRWRNFLALTPIPLAYAAWVLYRTFVLGDTKPDTTSFRGLIASTLLSPARNQVVKDNEFMWPWKAMSLAIKRALQLSFANPWLDLVFGVFFLILVILAWSRLRTSYRLYVAVIVIVSFSFHTGMAATGGAYLSLPRHLFLAFPVFIGLGARLADGKPWIIWFAGTVVMTFFLFGFFWARLVP